VKKETKNSDQQKKAGINLYDESLISKLERERGEGGGGGGKREREREREREQEG
jgi:hypothetical protein